ncbi:hypothetical protein [Tumebacillus permanentifrigoris]|uniref:Putative secreted protein with PEP-CTERM sorting signal n=1 Tax=Tumebacillus permanentifrigoris TaxID=378543 RepID=A0A316DCD4_9BACL|nr:hypothetical protein [Tumebacillus permanentifrigoris]PWK15807.1 putative secreted protein with PEP-CTERM sorting signal [Tumebacillus permanentifrigoris]
MKKRYLLLLLLMLFPVLLALVGYNSWTDNPPKNYALIRGLLVNPGTIAMLGGVVGMLLFRQRAMYWGMLVSFLYTYFALGLVWGSFSTLGVFDNHTLTTATLMSVVGFVAALFTMLLTRVLRKAIDAVNEPNVGQQNLEQKKKPRE